MWVAFLLAFVAAEPAEALASIDFAAQRLEAVRYGATRTTHTRAPDGTDQVTTEHWRYVSEPGGHFRVDYFGDTQRQIACDGALLSEYLPARRELRRYDLAAMEPEERNALLGRILTKVGLPGVRTGWDAAADLVSPTWVEDLEVEGRKARAIVATAANGDTLRFTIDAERGYLLASEIRQADQFVVRTEARSHEEAAPGLWVPTEIRSLSASPGGPVRVVLSVNGLQVGQDAIDSLFTIETDPSIRVVDIP